MAGGSFGLLFNYFLKTAENIVTNFDDDKDKRNRILKDLECVIEKNCAHEAKIKNVKNTVKNLVNNDDADLDQVLQNFKLKKEELLDYTPNVSNHPDLIEYCRQVKEIVNNADGTGRKTIDDDDIEMTQDDINIIDPFTKVRMNDPVKNKICGHIYDRESVTKVLVMNKNTRCPVVGCINKDPVLLENLVADIVTRKYLHDNPS